MTSTAVPAILLLSWGVSLVTVPLSLRFAQRRGMLDLPGGRHTHTVAVPRIGGVGILAGFFSGTLLAAVVVPLLMRQRHLPFDWAKANDYVAIVLGAVLIFAVGLTDDLWRRREGQAGPAPDGLPALLRLILQIVAAIIPITAGVWITSIRLPGDHYLYLPPAAAALLTVLWIVGVTNALNFIDGLDGLAGGVSLIMCATIGIIAHYGPKPSPGTELLAVALLGGLMGFLKHNFPPARIYMGDGGAYLLGYLLSTLAISGVMKGATLIAVLSPLVILALPILNLAGVVSVRVLHGRSPMAADREHLQHRLTDAGWTDLSALLFVYAICGLCASAALSLFWMPRESAFLAGGVAVLLVSVAARRSRPAPPADPKD